MRLDYKLLWFDDQLQQITPFTARIASAISRLGFEPHIDLRIVTGDVENPLADIPSQNDVDLVLMDYKLGGQHNGAELAKQIRRSYRDTDIIFYSSEPASTLRRLIFDKGIDGVFCSSRVDLTDRATGVINGQLRRILDLNHMRGIVMAATSDLDHAMIECLEMVQAIVYAGDSKEFALGVSTKIADAMRSKAKQIEELGQKGKTSKLLREPSFGAALRLSVLTEEIAKLAAQIREPYRIDQLASYHTDVITPRNDFAHRKAAVIDGVLVLEGRTEPLNHETLKAMRLRLLEHSDNFGGLLSLLRELADASGEKAVSENVAIIENTMEQVTASALAAEVSK